MGGYDEVGGKKYLCCADGKAAESEAAVVGTLSGGRSLGRGVVSGDGGGALTPLPVTLAPAPARGDGEIAGTRGDGFAFAGPAAARGLGVSDSGSSVPKERRFLWPVLAPGASVSRGEAADEAEAPAAEDVAAEGRGVGGELERVVKEKVGMPVRTVGEMGAIHTHNQTLINKRNKH
jgi:hypothetical protein